MDDASEDSRPAQPGFIKKFFLTMSQVRDLFVAFTLFEFLSVLNDHHQSWLQVVETVRAYTCILKKKQIENDNLGTALI